MSHLDSESVGALVSGALSVAEREASLAHLADCDDCRTWVASMVRSDPASAKAEQTGMERYVIEFQIGGGGMGIVFQAWDQLLERHVALKLIKNDGATDADRARLLREARAMAQLNHENVVRIYDAGQTGNEVFLAMEKLDGTTLQRWSQEGRSPKEILRVCLQVARGLSAAHAAGIIHGDIKPDNVMVDSTGTARIVDFGLAWSQRVSTADVAGGTPEYMAPELRRGEAASPQSDIYSFCLLVSECLTGKRFGPTTTPSQHPGAVRPAIAKATRSLLEAGTSIDPMKRPRAMTEVVTLLEASLRSQSKSKKWSAVAAVLLAVCGGAFWATDSNPLSRQCAELDEVFREQWTAEKAEAIPIIWPDETGASVMTAIERHIESWQGVKDSLCRARLRDATASARQLACLGDSVRTLGVVTDVLPRVKSEKALDVVHDQQSPQRCLELATLAGQRERTGAQLRKSHDLRLEIFEARLTLVDGRVDEARERLRALQERAASAGLPGVRAEALTVDARAVAMGGDFVTSQRLHDEAIRLAEQDHNERVLAQALLGSIETLLKQGRPNDALSLARRSEDRFVRFQMPYHLARLRYFQASGWSDLRKEDKALPFLREALGIFRELFPAGHPMSLKCLHRLGSVHSALGQSQEGERIHREALALSVALYGAESHQAAGFELALGFDAQVRRSFAEATRHYQSALGTFEKVSGPADGKTVQARYYLCTSLCNEERYTEAIPVCQKAVSGYGDWRGKNNPEISTYLVAFAGALEGAGRPKEALPILERALVLRQARPSSPQDLGWIQLGLATVLKKLGRQPARSRRLASAAREVFDAAGQHIVVTEEIDPLWPELNEKAQAAAP